MEKYAGFWIRLVASFVDIFVFLIVSYIIKMTLSIRIFSLIFASLYGPNPNLTTFFEMLLYLVLMTYFKQATIGKMMVGIKVKSFDGSSLSLGKVILRETIGKILSAITFGIGFIMTAFTDNKRGLHDIIAKTVVVYKDPNKSNAAGLVFGIIAMVMVILYFGFTLLFYSS